jgi:hypothetical protein
MVYPIAPHRKGNPFVYRRSLTLNDSPFQSGSPANFGDATCASGIFILLSFYCLSNFPTRERVKKAPMYLK